MPHLRQPLLVQLYSGLILAVLQGFEGLVSALALNSAICELHLLQLLIKLLFVSTFMG